MRSCKIQLLQRIMNDYNINSSIAEDIFWQAIWCAHNCDWQMPIMDLIHHFVEEDDYFSYETDTEKSKRIKGIAP